MTPSVTPEITYFATLTVGLLALISALVIWVLRVADRSEDQRRVEHFRKLGIREEMDKDPREEIGAYDPESWEPKQFFRKEMSE